MPRSAKIRHRAVTTMLFPTSEPVPRTARQGAEDLPDIIFLAVASRGDHQPLIVKC